MTGAMKEKSAYGIVFSILFHIVIITVPFNETTFKTQGVSRADIKFFISDSHASATKIMRSINPYADKPSVKKDTVVKKKANEKPKIAEKREEIKIDGKKPELITEAVQEPADTGLAEHPEINEQIAEKEMSRTAGIKGPENIFIKEEVNSIDVSPAAEKDSVNPESVNTRQLSDEPYIGAFGKSNGPRFLKKASVSYPAFARRIGKESKVLLRLTIDEKGKLDDVEVVSKGGFGFDNAAVEAVKQSTFLPAERNGKTVKSKAMLTVSFELR